MSSSNVGSAVVPDEIGNLDRARTQTLLVTLVEALERDGGQAGRGKQKLESGTRCPSLVKGMAGL